MKSLLLAGLLVAAGAAAALAGEPTTEESALDLQKLQDAVGRIHDYNLAGETASGEPEPAAAAPAAEPVADATKEAMAAPKKGRLLDIIADNVHDSGGDGGVAVRGEDAAAIAEGRLDHHNLLDDDGISPGLKILAGCMAFAVFAVATGIVCVACKSASSSSKRRNPVIVRPMTTRV